MDGVLVESIDDDGSLRHVWADQAFYAEDTWTLHQGYLRLIHPEGRETSYAFDRYRPMRLTVSPEELLDDPPDEEKMSYANSGGGPPRFTGPAATPASCSSRRSRSWPSRRPCSSSSSSALRWQPPWKRGDPPSESESRSAPPCSTFS